MDRSVVVRAISESVLIVVSILLALSADAWLDSRKQAVQLDGQMAALARDFDTMLEKVDASHYAANRGVESGRHLSTLMQEGSEIDPDLPGIGSGISFSTRFSLRALVRTRH